MKKLIFGMISGIYFYNDFEYEIKYNI